MLEFILDFITTFFDVYGVACFIIATFLGFGISIIAKKIPPKVSMTLILFFVVLPFTCWIFASQINPRYVGYGYAVKDFKVAVQEDSVLWIINSSWISNYSETGGESEIMYRIQGLNLDSGTKLFRKLIPDEFETLGHKNHLVWASTGKGIIGMDLMTGETRITVNEQNLMGQFPEFAKGVYEYKYNPKTFLIDVISQDGLRISVDPVSNVKVDHPIESATEEHYEVNNYGISKKYEKSIISLDRNVRQKLVNQYGDVLNNDLVFLKGKFLLFDEPSSKVLVMSYETLDKKGFILRYLSLDGKLLWQAKQHDLKVGDFFNAEPEFEKALFYKDKVIMAFEGFVFSLDSSDGHLNWLTRM